MSVLMSVVTPVYKAETIVSELSRRVVESVSGITNNFEVIFVCDGSPDDSWGEICKVCGSDNRLKGLKLTRNFGQDYAIAAGLSEAKGDWVVVMDCDLQDNPKDIPSLYAKALEGYDVVFALRTERKDGFFKKLSSKIFYAVFNYLTDTKQDSRIGNFGIFHSKVIRCVEQMHDSVRNFTTMIHWTGFEIGYVSVSRDERFDGKSSYSLAKLFTYSKDIIVAFSNKPLTLMVKFGFLLSFFSFLVGIYYFVQYAKGVTDVVGYTSLIVSLWFLSGLIIMFMGVLGLYLSKTFDNTKHRPHFVIGEKVNF